MKQISEEAVKQWYEFIYPKHRGNVSNTTETCKKTPSYVLNTEQCRTEPYPTPALSNDYVDPDDEDAWGHRVDSEK